MDGSKDSSAPKSLAPSSLVDLKAELFRKQKEYKQQKAVSSQDGNYIVGKKISKPEKKKTIWRGKNSGVEKRSEADQVDRYSRKNDDEERLAASRVMLEAKSKLYEKMSKDGDNADDEDGNSLYLVDFERKYIDKAMESRENRLAAEQKKSAAADVDDTEPYVENEQDVPDEEKWVDYTDALGRTRRCMKKDLSHVQSMVSSMRQTRADKMSGMDGVTGYQSDSKPSTSTSGGVGSGLFSEAARDLMSADMHREMLREKWEKEQRELLDAQETVHYANVQFDEQRAHGVAFYQFSKKEEERQKEMEKLKQLREETKTKREAKESLKAKRKAQLAARLEKVRQRRIAQGLPVPELKAEQNSSDDDETIGPVAPPPSEPELTNQELDNAEPAKKKVREWDVGKPAILEPQRPEKPRSWVNPRDTRDDDFAPPTFYYDNKTSLSINANPQKPTKEKFGEIMSKNRNQSSDIQVSKAQDTGIKHFKSFSLEKKLTKQSVGNQNNVSDIPIPGVTVGSDIPATYKPHTDRVTSNNIGDIPLPGQDTATKSSIDSMLKSLRNQT